MPELPWAPICQATNPLTGAPCQDPATVHLLLLFPAAGFGMVAVCTYDAHLIRHVMPVNQLHWFEDDCGMPGTVWDRRQNRCVIDETGIEPMIARETLANAR